MIYFTYLIKESKADEIPSKQSKQFYKRFEAEIR